MDTKDTVSQTLQKWEPTKTGSAETAGGGTATWTQVPFSDNDPSDPIPPMSFVIELRGYEDSWGVQGIQCVWMRPDGTLKEGRLHGRAQGTFRSLKIDVLEGEYLYLFSNRAGDWNDHTEFLTNRMSKLALGLLPGGQTRPMSVGSAPLAGMIVGVYGCTGSSKAAIRNLGTLVVPGLPALPKVTIQRPPASAHDWMSGGWGSWADTPGSGWGGFAP